MTYGTLAFHHIATITRFLVREIFHSDLLFALYAIALHLMNLLQLKNIISNGVYAQR
jgi:hypothetical protein